MLLINGCSFAERWTPSQKLLQTVGCDTFTNLGVRGTSFQRTVRSTIEWVSKYGKPNCVIIPITLASRWELAVGKTDKHIDGSWIGMQHPQYLNFDDIDKAIPVDKLTKLIELYYGVIPNVISSWDKLFTEIIALASFLDHNEIKYLMFDMCNNFERKHLQGIKGIEKIKLIEKNTNIINLFDFCGNKFMYEQLPSDEQRNIDAYMWHHHADEYLALEKYLIDYLNHKL